VNSAGLPAVILIGGGGHARILADSLRLGGRHVLGFTAPQIEPELAPGISWLGDDSALSDQDPAAVELANGLGSTGSTCARRQLFAAWCQRGFRFANICHPSAAVSELDVVLGEGCQLLAGSVVGPGVRLAANVLINSRAVVEHDCEIASHSHVATGAVLCGTCRVGEGVHIGAGACIIQGITIGSGAIIAAGSVVTRDVEPLTLIAGVPAVHKRALDEEDLEGHQHPM